MSSRSFGRRLAMLGVLAALVAGCASTPLPSTTIIAPSSASGEALSWAIEAGLAERRWITIGHSPGIVEAHIRSNGTGDYVRVEISYGAGVVTIRPVKWSIIRERYSRWMNLLSADIRKNIAQIGMGRGGPPAPAASDP
jgi:hypothetical protein